MNMERDVFLGLPASEVAGLVNGNGSEVCAFAVNGTRRWFRLENLRNARRTYLEHMCTLQIQLCHMFFENGLNTLLMPVFGPELLGRGLAYRRIAIEGLERLASDERLVKFYQAQGVRVRFYGNYEAFFARTKDTVHLSRIFGDLMQSTKANTAHRLFLGVCAQDPAEDLAALAVRLYKEYDRVPTKAELVEAYYGEPVDDVKLFIGFDRFSAFDMPLLSTDDTDLYFTVSPSPYITDHQLREILYDHLFVRSMTMSGTATGLLDDPALDDMRTFYKANEGHTQGLGFKWGNVWYPLPQVEIPEHMRIDHE
jgi:tuberculosinol/isotuberculosinol synthase